MKLTAKRVAKLAKRPGRHADGNGLYLQVINPDRGRASWVLRYQRNGRERWHGLGPLRLFTLKEARERARKAKQQIHDGGDPIAARKAEKVERALAVARQMTFADAVKAYFEQHEAKWRNAHHRLQFKNSLDEYAIPVIGQLPVGNIDTPLVLRVLEQKVEVNRGWPAGRFWDVRTETASRVRARIEAVLDWAAVRGYRSGDNPARWKGHLAEVLPRRGQIQRVEHHPALPFADVPAFMVALRDRTGTAARALEFTILTAARTGEVIGATWAEINMHEKTWTIPAGRIKGGKEHRVPLSDRAVEILETLPREDGNPYVFIGPYRGGLSGMAMGQVLKRMGRTDITVHGFRSTFRDWAAERSNYPNHVIEMALAHSIGDAVEAAYRRGNLFDKRRKLMDDWARYCTAPPVAADRNNVTSLRAAR
jgi:integrase